MSVTLPSKIVTLSAEDRDTYRNLMMLHSAAAANLNQWLKAYKEKHGPSEASPGGYTPFYKVEMAMMDDLTYDGSGSVHAVFERTLRS